jgi:hypothetical protein
MLGPAAVVAVALCAFAGADSAAATELCTVNESPCAAVNMYPSGTAVKEQLKAGVLSVLTGTFLVECQKSTIEGTTQNTGSATETVKVLVTAMTFTECGVCTVTVNKLPALEIHASGGGNGTVTLSGFTATIKCSGITCKYAGGITTGMTIIGGFPAKMVVNESRIAREEGPEAFCGAFGAWDAEYEITAPKPLFVV